MNTIGNVRWPEIDRADRWQPRIAAVVILGAAAAAWGLVIAVVCSIL